MTLHTSLLLVAIVALSLAIGLTLQQRMMERIGLAPSLVVGAAL